MTGANDDVDNDGRGTAISHTASGGGYDGQGGGVRVWVTDDEPDPTVTLALSPATINESGATEADGVCSGGLGLWGRFTQSGFAAESEGYGTEGRLKTVHAGVDHQLGDHLLVGAAASRSANQVAYHRAGDASAFQGEADILLRSVLPYLRLSVGGFSIWGLYGRGSGEVHLTDGLGVEAAGLAKSLAAVGLRNEVLSVGSGWRLALKGDAFSTILSADRTDDHSTWMNVHAHRARMLLESRLDLSGATSTMSLVFEAGGRVDEGDAVSGNGLEVGARMSLLNSEIGLDLTYEGRYTVLHQDERFENWSASGAVSLDPGVRGQGLSVSVAPSWGNPQAGAMHWLTSDLSGVAPTLAGSGVPFSAGARPGSYEATLRYGWPVRDGPRRELRATLTDGWRTGPGLRVGGGTSLSERLGLMMSLELTRQHRPDGGPGTAMRLRIHNRDWQ